MSTIHLNTRWKRDNSRGTFGDIMTECGEPIAQVQPLLPELETSAIKRNEWRNTVAERIATEHNALLGIENPQEALRMAREALSEVLEDGLQTNCKAWQQKARKALAALGAQPEEKE